MERVRTPDTRFENLPDFAFAAHYADVADPDGGPPLRMAYVDEGKLEGDVIVLLHGEPSWSFLYRFMIPPLVACGHRVVAPDLVGFGRSDKPLRREDYTYARHVEWLRALLLDHLELTEMTLFGQDWGSLVGLRVVSEHPERFARVAIGNGALPTGDEPLSEALRQWQEYSQRVDTLAVGGVVSAGCRTRLTPEIIAAYDAPFPDERFKAGARVFPLLIPTTRDDPAHEANVAAWKVLASWTKPFLCCYSDADPITRGADRKFLRVVPGAVGQAHTVIEGAGHFLQEEKGPELADVLHRFMATT